MVTINTSDDVLRLLAENPEWKAAVRRAILTEELMNLPARFNQFVDEQRQFNDEQRQFNAKVDGFIERTDQRFGHIERDISNMRGEYARNVAVREADDMAQDMGLQMVQVLTDDDIRELLRTSDTVGILTSELRSFRRADLIIEAADGNGITNYIAVEVSNSADDRDTRRALRNAGFLTRFTGYPARAAIASVRIDDRIQETVNSGGVYWHELEDRDPAPE